MSRDFDNNMKKIIDSNKELHKDTDKCQKDLCDLKRSLKMIDNRLATLEEKIDQIFEILNTFSLMIAEEEEDQDYLDEEDIENNEWTPYDDHNWETEDPLDDEDDLNG